MVTAQIYDNRVCSLGEGPLWHPLRKQLFWFDILKRQLHSVEKGEQKTWQFENHVSAAGWVDDVTLLIATDKSLITLNLEDGEIRDIVPMEEGNAQTRSNDGRADPFGGFWVGTMGYKAEAGAGAIYRYFQGELVPLFQGITIPNAICFSPDKQFAYFTDTPTRQIMRQALDHDGWPAGTAEVLIDLGEQAQNPDGSVVDSEGFLWIALWGSNQVVRYSAQGDLDQVVHVPAEQPSCPAFGGQDLRTLFVTSATQSLASKAEADGKTMSAKLQLSGQREHRVILNG